MLDLTYLFQDRDSASMEVAPRQVPLLIDSHGETMCGLCRIPGGKQGQLHPAVILLHGFPGNEQSQDLTQALRRIGMAAILVHYRGSWGSRGNYHFSNLPEDAACVLAYVKEHAQELSIDPQRIYLFSHSMGSFAWLGAFAQGIDAKGYVCTAPCDLAAMYNTRLQEDFEPLMVRGEGFLHLESVQSLRDECEAHREDWLLPALAQHVPADLPMLMVTATQDVATPPALHADPLVQALQDRGQPLETVAMDCGHTFDSHRVTYIRTVCEWLAGQEAR